jgi:hypothetical protein
MMFQDWCTLNGMQAIPASPTTISRFINSIAPLGIEKVFEAVQEISRAHYTIGLPCPCSGPGLVTRAVNAVSKIEAPRSWPAELKAQFMHLPWDVQTQILKRETERDLAVRKAQNEAGEARNALAALKMEKAA